MVYIGYANPSPGFARFNTGIDFFKTAGQTDTQLLNYITDTANLALFPDFFDWFYIQNCNMSVLKRMTVDQLLVADGIGKRTCFGTET